MPTLRFAHKQTTCEGMHCMHKGLNRVVERAASGCSCKFCLRSLLWRACGKAIARLRAGLCLTNSGLTHSWYCAGIVRFLWSEITRNVFWQRLSRGRAERIHTQNHTHPHPHPHPYPHTHACAVRELTHTHKDANTHTTGSHARTRHAHAHTRTFRTQHARTHARTRERTPAGPLRRRKWTKGGCSFPFVRAAVVRHRHPLTEDIRSATSSLSRSCAHTHAYTSTVVCDVFVFASAWERAGSVSSQRSRPLTVGTGAGPRMTGARGGAGGGRGWQGPGRAGRVQKTDGCCCRFRMVEKTGKHE